MLTRKQETEARELAAGKLPRATAAKIPDTAEGARIFLDAVEQAEREQLVEGWTAERAAQGPSRAERRRKAQAKAQEVSAIRSKLQRSGEGHQTRSATLAKEAGEARMDDKVFDTFLKGARTRAAGVGIDEQLAVAERQYATTAQVLREPGPYDAGSPASWVRDVIVAREAQVSGPMTQLVSRSSTVDMSLPAVTERLDRHAQDVRHAMLRPGDKYGRQVRKMLHEGNRGEDEATHRRLAGEEVRSFTTGGGATASASGGQGAAFVTPAVLIDHIWAPFRSPYRAFCDQLDSSVALPEYGLTAYAPIVTTGTTVATQVEGAAVGEGVPVTSYISSPIVCKTGQIEVTQQFLDRAGPGIQGDQVLFTQLRQQLDAQIDAYSLNQAIAGAQTVTNNGSFAVTTASGVGGLMKDLKTAKNALHDTAGVRIRGSHVFASGDFVDYISGYADAQGRPMFVPTFDDNQLPIRAVGDQAGEGFSGYVLVGCALFADDNVPTVGTTSQTQLVVCRPDTILQLEGNPIPYVYPPSIAGSLTAILGARCYTATIARFKEGVATVSGSAYSASTFA